MGVKWVSCQGVSVDLRKSSSIFTKLARSFVYSLVILMVRTVLKESNIFFRVCHPCRVTSCTGNPLIVAVKLVVLGVCFRISFVGNSFESRKLAFVHL